MDGVLLAHEPQIRLAVFVAVFAVLAVVEAIWSRRTRAVTRWLRWPSNLGVSVLNTALVRVLFPLAGVGAALFAHEHDVGLLNWLDLPASLSILVAVLLLDLAIYLQHVMFHASSVLWRVHRMHHADLDFDVTTGIRFHPVEIVLSMMIKLGVVLAFGAPAAAVVIFEMLLSTTSLFNHTNLRLPAKVDSVLRWLLVTPDMHRVHHSVAPREINSNYGFNVPWWDLLFGTYRAQPEAGHEAMSIGIEQFREPHDLRLDRMLLQPLIKPA